ncbi:MAG: MerR family transcriptional regulator [Planctomycetia bacterium]|nr:MerR family transcriptional regulator [Planctomycetia bacterium]
MSKNTDTTINNSKHSKKFQVSTDKTPKYTIKQVAEMMELSTYAVRYYDNEGLIPNVYRSAGNVRLFSDYSISWLRLIHCLRTTGLSIEGVKRYIDLCLIGDSTIPERAELIFKQEKILREQLRILKKQMEILTYKKKYYQELLKNPCFDNCNPQSHLKIEPNIIDN